MAVIPRDDPSIESDSRTGASAALDLGTNSFHLVIAEFDDAGRFQVIAKHKESVRLGHGSGDMKELSPEAMERGVASLVRMRQIADAHDAELAAVATSAVREALNRAEFLHRARQVAGVNIEVIQGVEEARLIHLGAIQAVPVADRRHLVIDIGGGSTEFVLGEGTDPLVLRSLKLGAIRLTDRFFGEEPPKKKAVKHCRLHVRSFLNVVAQAVEPLGFEITIGCSGTIETVVRVAHRLANPASASRETNGVANPSATADEIHGATEAIVAATPEERLEMGIDKTRVDLIVAGAVLLDEIVRVLGIESIAASEFALREGILLDRRQRAHGDSFRHLSDIRRSGVEALAERHLEDTTHVRTITDLSLRLFDLTAHRHQLDDGDRALLEASGLLHNIGLSVSHSAHHKHSYYLIRHSDALAGFNESELEVIALVARYHRKSAPKAKHPVFAQLDEGDQDRVRVLAGLQRIAIALDRSRSAVVSDLTLDDDDDELTFVVSHASTADVSLELYTANQRSGLLSTALDAAVRFEVNPLETTALETTSLETTPVSAPSSES